MIRQEDFSVAVLAKARAVPAEDIRPHEADSSVWFVKSSRTGEVHRVQFIEEWVTCTCPHGDVRVRQSLCYHAGAAVLMRDGEHPGQAETTEAEG